MSDKNADRASVLIARLAAKPSDIQYSELYKLIREAEHLADEDSPRLEELIAAINAAAPLETDRVFFATMYGWTSADELAQTWAAPLPGPVNDLSDRELLALIVSLHDNLATPQLDRFLRFLAQSLGSAFSTDLIFWPYGQWSHKELVAEIRKRQTLLAEGGAALLSTYEIEIARQIMADDNSPSPMQTWAHGTLKQAELKPSSD